MKIYGFTYYEYGILYAVNLPANNVIEAVTIEKKTHLTLIGELIYSKKVNNAKP